jgi:phosphinothricin acetyltransferase
MSAKGVALKIRAAQIFDAGAISDIYNYYVENSTCTFELNQETQDARENWLAEHQGEGLPVIVGTIDGQVVAWGSLSYYHTRCAYRQTVEPSVYVHHQHVKQGLGKATMQHLIDLARTKGYHCLVGLSCSENAGSIAMSEALGFERVGELKEVGRKFDRWLDVTILQMLLA